MWRFRSHDPSFGNSTPEDWISAGDPVMGLTGNIRGIRGKAVRDQRDTGFESYEVTIKWEDGRQSTVPVDMVTSLKR